MRSGRLVDVPIYPSISGFLGPCDLWAAGCGGCRQCGGLGPIPHRSVAEGVLAMKPPWLIIVAARW